jgi:pyruvate dehydrogenase E2 component (dihydrolipoamide acetyltransferase)
VICRAGAAGVPQAPAESIPLTRLRAAIGRRMQASKQQVPHFYLTVDLDVRNLVDLRSQLNAVQPEDARFSVNDFVVKAAALALRDVPGLNASLLGDSLVRHAEVNIGVAVAVDEGLLTVVVRQADLKSLRQIGEEVRAMAARPLGRVRPRMSRLDFTV